MSADYWFIGGALLFITALALALVKVLTKMLEDELSARLDDVPALLVALALRRLPPDQREYYRPEWEDDLLAAFNARNKRYPLWKLISSVKFVFPLFISANGIRKQTRIVRQQGLEDERNVHVFLVHSRIGSPELQLEAENGDYWRVAFKDGGRDLSLTTKGEQFVYGHITNADGAVVKLTSDHVKLVKKLPTDHLKDDRPPG